MKKISFIMAALMLITMLSGCSAIFGPAQQTEAPAEEAMESASAYQYFTAEEVKAMIENGDAKTIVDIQPQEYYDLGHLPTSTATYAYPADTDALCEKLAAALEKINENEDPVIIVGLGGKTGAENAVDYYVAQGVAASRLYILEGGAMSWPYDELKWTTIDFHYITPDDYVKNVEDSVKMMVIDVRQPEYYNAGHLSGAIATSSFPNSNKAQWDSLDALTEQINACIDPIIVVCMSGKMGAVNAISHYAANGIDPRKFCILEGGGQNWPYPEMLEITPNFQYIAPDALVAKMDAKEEMILLSVQTKENYRETGHLPDSIATYAFPADTPELQKKLSKFTDDLAESTLPIMVMCHGGKTGAINAITYYVNHGIDETRFFIIEGGITAWPYPDMLETGY